MKKDTSSSHLSEFGRFSEPALLILISLAEGPKHGYAMAEDIRGVAGVRLGPGTLYGAIARLESRGLIEALERDDRRNPYQLTALGERSLRERLASPGGRSSCRLGTVGWRMNWLLRLYPRAWRRRYGSEMEELVGAQPRSLQLFIDLLAGAVDAHFKPQAHVQPGTAGPGEPNMFTRIKGCSATERISSKDAFQSGALTIGSALVLAALVFVWKDPAAEGVVATMFLGVLAVGAMSLSLRGQSTAAKVVLIGGMFLILFAIGFLASLL